MCRLAAYLGPEIQIDSFLVKPKHSLLRQSRHPRELPPDVLNADGYGFAWYTPDGRGPAVYRSVLPMWGDENLPSVAPYIRTHCLVAATRSATSDMPTGIANTAPYARGHLSFVHNGFVDGFHTKMMRPIRANLSEARAAKIRGNTDSEHIFAMIDEELHPTRSTEATDRTNRLATAVQRGLARIRTCIEAAHEKGQLNVIATDGESLVATRYAVGQDAPTLYICDRGLGDVRIASEALDDGEAWNAVPPDTLVVASLETRASFESVLTSAVS